MATITLFNCFTEDLAEKKHNLGSDQLVIALCAAANAPVTTNTVLANLTQIAYTNLSTRNITTTSSSQSSGTYKLALTDHVLTASGGAVATFRYIVVYNDTATNDELIGFIDAGSNIDIPDGGTYTLNFSEGNGVITLTPS